MPRTIVPKYHAQVFREMIETSTDEQIVKLLNEYKTGHFEVFQ